MELNNVRISIIIPTMNRPEVLENICLPSLAVQSFRDFEVIVWDASDNDQSQIVVNEFLEKYRDLSIRYFSAPRRGLTSQRNDAVKFAKGDIILFIDDDVSLEPNFLEELLKVYNSDKQKIIGGAQGVILLPNEDENIFRNIVKILVNIYSSLFMLPRGSKYQKVLISGRYTSFSPIPLQKVFNNLEIDLNLEWLSGCCMSYRSEVFREFGLKFDERFERFGGYAYMEDGDFSYRVFKNLGFKLARIRSAKCIHYHIPGGRGNKKYQYAGRVYNHFLFWRKNITLSLTSITAFGLSQIGLLGLALANVVLSLSLEPIVGFLIGWREIVRVMVEK